MSKPKYPIALIVLLLLVIGGFTGPVFYQSYSVYKKMSRFDYENLSTVGKIGDTITTKVIINENKTVRIFRKKQYYRDFKGYARASNNIRSAIFPSSFTIVDDENKNAFLTYSDTVIAYEIFDSPIAVEVNDSILPFIYEEDYRNDSVHLIRIVEDNQGNCRKGNVLKSSSEFKYGSFEKSKYDIDSKGFEFKEMTYEKRLTKAPSLTFSHIEQMKGVLVFGDFEVVSSEPLTLNCIKISSLIDPEERKRDLIMSRFRGTNLIISIASLVFFIIGMIIALKTIITIVKGKPLN